MEQEKILIVGSNRKLFCLIREHMAPIGIKTDYTDQIPAALAQYVQQEYCLAIIDVHILDQIHLDLIVQMRQSKPTPILVLSLPLSPENKLILFQSGANALMEEPFSADVCVAQVYALIHLFQNTHSSCRKSAIVHGTELIINPHYRQVLIDGRPLTLTRKEFDLLQCFAGHPGQVFSYEQLYYRIWNEDITLGNDDTVKSHIKTLRKKLSSVGKSYIQNVWGIGYKFVLDPKI